MAAEFMTAAKTSEIPVGGVTAIDVRGTRIAVANVGGTYYAFDDACTHEQCSLAEVWGAGWHHPHVHVPRLRVRRAFRESARASGDSAGQGVSRAGRGGYPADRGVMAPRYVIVGASLAGATAAITLREEGADGTVTLIGAENELPYERPPLSKAYLRGDVPFEKALVRPAAFYAEHGIETMFGARATRIDPSTRIVELEDRRRVPFDALLIATGGRNRRMSIPGSDLEGIYGLRTVQDADRIRDEMIAGQRVVVVGMGFIGSEVAASLRQKGLDVVAIDPSKTPLFRVLGEAVGQTIADLHRAHGVRTVFEETVAAFEGTGRVNHVVTKAGCVSNATS